MKSKRGISPLLASVLLVALAITMAAIVSNFVINKTKEFNPEQIAEQSLFCDSVSLGYTINDPDKLNIYGENDNDPNTGKRINAKVSLFSPVTLINRGAFSIHQFIVNAPGVQSLTYFIFDKNGKITVLKPGADNKYDISIQVNTDPNIKNTEIKIIPVIKDLEKNQSVKCIDRQLIINYKQLCLDIKKAPC